MRTGSAAIDTDTQEVSTTPNSIRSRVDAFGASGRASSTVAALPPTRGEIRAALNVLGGRHSAANLRRRDGKGQPPAGAPHRPGGPDPRPRRVSRRTFRRHIPPRSDNAMNPTAEADHANFPAIVSAESCMSDQLTTMRGRLTPRAGELPPPRSAYLRHKRR